MHSTSGSRAGFEDVTGHDVPLSLYLDLLKHMNVENMIILTLIIGTSEWSGSCHGIAATMALAFADELDLSQIESGVEYYYDMSLPCDNKKFLDCIEYFYLGQIAMDYQGGSGSELKNVFPELIKELDENPVLFSYRYSGGGHTILALDYKKDIDGSYLVTMYDMNSYYSGSKGRFTELKISKDYGSFSLTTPSGTVLTENEISYLQFSTVDDVNEINPYSGVESARNAEGSNGKVEFADATVITIPMTEHSFEIENSRGEKLICDENGRFSGSMEILGMKGFFSDVQSDSAWELTVANSDYFRLVKSDAAINLGFYSGESCMVIDGENLGHVTVVPGSSIEIEPAEEADTYDFSAYLSADMVEDYGVRVVQISGTASGKTTLNVDDGRICAAADSLISKELVLIDGVDKYPLGDLDSRDNIIELAADRPTVKVNNAAAGPGCEVDVSICIDNNPGIADMVLEMEYDPSVMSLCKVTDEGALGNPVNADDMGQIPYRFGWSNDRNYAANGNVITLTFRISEDADIGEYPLQLKLCSALDESSNEVTLAVDNSVLSIKPGYVSSEVPDGCGIIVLGGYDFGQLVDCRVVTDPGVTVTEKVDGDEVWMFFLEENTYAPVCPAKRVRD